MDDQVQEASHSDELKEQVRVSRKHTKAPDARGQRLDEDNPGPPKHDDEAPRDASMDASARGEPGVRKSSS